MNRTHAKTKPNNRQPAPAQPTATATPQPDPTPKPSPTEIAIDKVRQRLPHKLRLELDCQIVKADDIRAAAIDALHKRFNLDDHRVARGMFKRYARGVRDDARDYFLAAMLGATFGRLDGDRTTEIHNAAQNMMAMLVAKTIKTLGDELDVNALAKMARINLELRKAAAITLTPDDRNDHARPGDWSLLKRKVHELYGLDFTADQEDRDNDHNGELGIGRSHDRRDRVADGRADGLRGDVSAEPARPAGPAQGRNDPTDQDDRG